MSERGPWRESIGPKNGKRKNESSKAALFEATVDELKRAARTGDQDLAAALMTLAPADLNKVAPRVRYYFEERLRRVLEVAGAAGHWPIQELILAALPEKLRVRLVSTASISNLLQAARGAGDADRVALHAEAMWRCHAPNMILATRPSPREIRDIFVACRDAATLAAIFAHPVPKQSLLRMARDGDFAVLAQLEVLFEDAVNNKLEAVGLFSYPL